jgi:hypothetical protein
MDLAETIKHWPVTHEINDVGTAYRKRPSSRHVIGHSFGVGEWYPRHSVITAVE